MHHKYIAVVENTTLHMDSLLGSNKMEEEESFLLAYQLATASTLPMVLRSAIELNLLELIKAAAPSPASASQLAAHIQTNDPAAAATQIDRILRFLAANSILDCHMETHPDGTLACLYSLAPVCKYLTKDVDGASLASLVLSVQDKVFMETWYHMKDAIMEGGIPFHRAHGMNTFEYLAKDPRLNKVFNHAMHDHSTIIMRIVLENYKGFEGVKSLLDVGGGTGATLKMILAKYPSIKAMNLDLPHVIQHAPPHPGVEHVSGDMFVNLPKADAIFIKWICHDWSDAHCRKLLKNCYEALPLHGKVIIIENILPNEEIVNTSSEVMATLVDVLMFGHSAGGRERSEQEFEALAKHAGFKQFHKVCYAFGNWVMELSK